MDSAKRHGADQSAREADLLSVKELARRLGVGERSIHRWHDAGVLPRAVRIGRLLRWKRTDIDSWLRDDCRPAKRR